MSQDQAPSFEAVIEAETDDLDDILHVTDAMYEQLLQRARATRARTTKPDRALRGVAEDTLFQETRLLDMRHYDDWLRMYTPDCIYWVPATPEVSDPRSTISIHLDDRRRLRDRIALGKTGHLHAQKPPSRTCRAISNVEAWVCEENPDHIQVRSNLTILHHRHGQTTTYAGWQDHILVPAKNGSGHMIRYRMLQLLNCDEPQGNITFIL